MIPVFRHLILLSLLSALLAACAGSGPPLRQALDTGGGAAGSELTILLPSAPELGTFPLPRDVGDALIFAQLYEGLTELDPTGRPGSALASSWRSEEDGRVWTFTLRDGARFWDGRPIEAADVGAAWLWNQHRAEARGLILPLRFGVGATELSFPAHNRIRIELALPDARLPELLALPCFAVSAGGRYLNWRLGSGPCRPASTLWRSGEPLDCKPHAAHARTARWRTLRFRTSPPGVLPVPGPEEADAVLLLDPALESHLARRPGLRRLEPPVDLVYFLFLPAGEALDAERWLPILRRDLEAGLMSHAALEPLDGEAPPAPALENAGMGAPFPLLGHDANDGVAAELARRIAALASLPSLGDGRLAGDLRIRALDRAELDAELVAAAAGQAASPLLLALPRDGARPAASHATLLPLALLRPSLVLRGSLVGLELGGDGIPRLDQLGYREGEATP
jgi:hypothetical protein